MDKHYDYVIIGFGKAGKTLAAKSAKKGLRVALIEKDKNMYGGTCINVGCIPSKSLIISAENAPKGNYEEKATYFAKAIEEKRRVTSFLREKNYQKVVGAGVDVIMGVGSFVSPHEIKVTNGNDVSTISGDKVFIDTGSVSRIPPIPGAKEVDGVLTSDGIMNLDTLPKDLTIIGAGYIGLEFASMMANFGSNVTILSDIDAFLPMEDDDISAAILSNLEAEGVKIVFGTKVTSIAKHAKGQEVTYMHGDKEEKILSDKLLLATGRAPNIASLNLENAGIEKTERGAIKTNEYLETSVKGIYALGDVNGGRQHTYVSLDDYRIVASSLFGDGSYTLKNRKEVPYSVFLSMPLSRAGLTEKEAQKRGIKYRVNKIPLGAVPKAQVLRKTNGLLKAVVGEDNKILGVSLLAPESFETINIVKMVMDSGLPYTYLRDFIFTHPTMTEALNDLFDF